jgi:glycolate oxidase
MALPNVEISTAPEDLLCYGFDASWIKGRPAMVAWPKSTGEIARLMKYAQERVLPVVPRGAGTGMTAGAVPTEGAMVMSLEKMDRIVEVEEGDLSVMVEPGVINGRLQRELAHRGFFYPPDPASMNFCTLGGNVAENAGGPRAHKYGVTRDYVMQLEAVLPGGDVITAGVGTHKGVVGYDLARLLTGSEGTLAVLSKIRLRFLPVPEDVTTLLAFFDDTEAAGRAVQGISAARIIPSVVEFMDREAIRAVEKYKPAGLPTDKEALLLIELDGNHRSIEQEAERVVDICQRLGARVQKAGDELAREKLWEARRAVSPALHNLGLMKINEDVVVPRSRLPEMLAALRKLSRDSGIMIVNFGHAGDGNIHVNVMVEKGDEEKLKRAMGLIKEIFSAVLALGGSISGEHGIGLTKAEYIGMEVGGRELELMTDIKRLFDPGNILNPGKIFGVTPPAGK